MKKRFKIGQKIKKRGNNYICVAIDGSNVAIFAPTQYDCRGMDVFERVIYERMFAVSNNPDLDDGFKYTCI